ncbi:MAG: hypothetical protein WCP93_00975 [Candidatus Berkelbacteria bacterium]
MFQNFKKIPQLLFIALAIFGFGYFLQHNHTDFNTNIGVAHAAVTLEQSTKTINSLHAELTSATAASEGTAWIFSVWKVMMGLANAFVAIILIFFAFVNIAHIEYDTYQLKKALPKLIIGIVMANFSMLICRMLVDLASVLTATFTHNPKGLMGGIMCAMGIHPSGSIGEYFLQILAQQWLWILLVVLAVFISILYLGILLLIRHGVILVLAAVAPIAFILLAFPPTESYFKKWWEWFVSWTFMGPIMTLILWMAGMVGGAGEFTGTVCAPTTTFSWLRAFTTLALLYVAGIVPSKLGGEVMGAYKNAVHGAGKAAYDNPWSKRKREIMGNDLKHKFYGNTKLGRWMEQGVRNDEAMLEAQKNEEEVRKGLRDLTTPDSTAERNAIAKERLIRLKTELENQGDERLAKHMKINIDAITDTDLASKKLKRAMDQIKKKGMTDAYKGAKGAKLTEEDIEDAQVTRDLDQAQKQQMTAAYDDDIKGTALTQKDIEDARVTRDLEAAKKNKMTLAYKGAGGDKLVEDELKDVVATGKMEKAKNDATARVYLGATGRKMAEFESGIANSQMAIDKVKDDQRVLMATERLAGHEIIHDLIKQYDKDNEAAGRPSNLNNAYKEVDNFTMELANAKTEPERVAAQAKLDIALTNLETGKKAFAADLHSKGKFATAKDADEFVENSHLQRYERTRHMAIIGKRVNDDATVDAQSMSSSAAIGDLVKSDGSLDGGSYGPYTWTAKTNEDFWKGVRSDDPDSRAGALGIATKLDTVKRKMHDSQTRGAAIKDYSKVISAGNPECFKAHISTAIHELKDAERAQLDKSLRDRGKTPASGTDFTLEDYSRILGETTLDTTTPNSVENKFASRLINSLQQNDDAEITYKDDAGVDQTIKGGFTGLGRQSHYYARMG